MPGSGTAPRGGGRGRWYRRRLTAHRRSWRTGGRRSTAARSARPGRAHPATAPAPADDRSSTWPATTTWACPATPRCRGRGHALRRTGWEPPGPGWSAAPRRPTRTLEAGLADWLGIESALVYSSGYLANIGAVRALCRPRTLIVSDAHNHASLMDGCRLAGAETVVTPHADVDAVAAALAEPPGPPGARASPSRSSPSTATWPRWPTLHAVARRHGALLLVDDAHALGVLGPGGAGGVAAAGLAGEPDVVVTATLSKSFGGGRWGGGRPGRAATGTWWTPAARSSSTRRCRRPWRPARSPRSSWPGPATNCAPNWRAGRARRPPGCARPGFDGADPAGGVISVAAPARRRRCVGRRLPGQRGGGGLLPPTVHAGQAVPAAVDDQRRRPRGGFRPGARRRS